MKKSIIMIYPNLDVGGIQTLIYRKCKWLVEKNYNIYLVTSSKGTMHSLFKKINVRLILVDDLFYSFIKFSKFMNFINNTIVNIIDIQDVAVVECFEPISSIFGIFLSKLINTKFITGVYHPKAYCTGFAEKHQRFDKMLMLLDKYNSILYMNYDVLNTHQNFYNIDIVNRNILYLPIEIKRERKEVQRLDEFIVVSVGRLVSFKKYIYGLISDFEDFYKKHKNVKLIIIGDGTEKKELLKHAKKCKSYKDGKINFLGTIPYEELDKYIYKASLGVGMGNSVLEIASAGVPAVIAPAFVNNNISKGFVCDDGDNIGDTRNNYTKTYKDCMEFLYEYSNEEYKQISNKCRQLVIDKYSIDNVMNQWFEKILNFKPIVLNEPLDDLVSKSVLRIFLLNKKIKERLKKFLNF